MIRSLKALRYIAAGHVHLDDLVVRNAIHDDNSSLLLVRTQVLASRRNKVYDVTVGFKINPDDGHAVEWVLPPCSECGCEVGAWYCAHQLAMVAWCSAIGSIITSDGDDMTCTISHLKSILSEPVSRLQSVPMLVSHVFQPHVHDMFAGIKYRVVRSEIGNGDDVRVEPGNFDRRLKMAVIRSTCEWANQQQPRSETQPSPDSITHASLKKAVTGNLDLKLNRAPLVGYVGEKTRQQWSDILHQQFACLMAHGHLRSENLRGSYVTTCADDIFGVQQQPAPVPKRDDGTSAASGSQQADTLRHTAQSSLAGRWFCLGKRDCNVIGEIVEVKSFSNGVMQVQYPNGDKQARGGGYIEFNLRSTVLVPGSGDKKRSQWILVNVSNRTATWQSRIGTSKVTWHRSDDCPRRRSMSPDDAVVGLTTAQVSGSQTWARQCHCRNSNCAATTTALVRDLTTKYGTAPQSLVRRRRGRGQPSLTKSLVKQVKFANFDFVIRAMRQRENAAEVVFSITHLPGSLLEKIMESARAANIPAGFKMPFYVEGSTSLDVDASYVIQCGEDVGNLPATTWVTKATTSAVHVVLFFLYFQRHGNAQTPLACAL